MNTYDKCLASLENIVIELNTKYKKMITTMLTNLCKEFSESYVHNQEFDIGMFYYWLAKNCSMIKKTELKDQGSDSEDPSESECDDQCDEKQSRSEWDELLILLLKLSAKNSMTCSFRDIGILYSIMREYNKAKMYYDYALEEQRNGTYKTPCEYNYLIRTNNTDNNDELQNYYDVYALIAENYSKQRKFKDAAKYYKLSIIHDKINKYHPPNSAIRTSNISLYCDLGNMYDMIKKYDDAIKCYELSIKRDEKRKNDAVDEMINVFEKQNKCIESIRTYIQYRSDPMYESEENIIDLSRSMKAIKNCCCQSHSGFGICNCTRTSCEKYTLQQIIEVDIMILENFPKFRTEQLGHYIRIDSHYKFNDKLNYLKYKLIDCVPISMSNCITNLIIEYI